MNEAITHEVMVTLRDAERAVHDTMPTQLADVVLAALSAEPATLAELETAIARYDQPVQREGFLQHMQTGLNESLWDAGLLLIDLPARLIIAVTEPALYEPQPRGFALYCPDPPPNWDEISEEEIIWLPYQLSPAWQFSHTLADWHTLAEERRCARAAAPPFDARPVLFGQLATFIARECLAARATGESDPVIPIHERWLLTPRADLRAQTPRAVLLAEREFIDSDLESRAHQWTFTGACPPGLDPHSIVYRCAGFGTHANVVYYDLVRYLVNECWQYVRVEPDVHLATETARLERLQADWLAAGGDYSHSPAWMLEQERRRLPVTMTSEESIIDHDCPLCTMAANPEFGPCFWHLDGSSMDLDDNWVFSFHPTQAEWEAERRAWEEHSRKFNEEWKQREAERAWAAGVPIHDDREVGGNAEVEDIIQF
jgi:hypothetical protein